MEITSADKLVDAISNSVTRVSFDRATKSTEHENSNKQEESWSANEACMA